MHQASEWQRLHHLVVILNEEAAQIVNPAPVTKVGQAREPASFVVWQSQSLWARCPPDRPRGGHGYLCLH